MLRGVVFFALGLSAHVIAHAAPPAAVTDLRIAVDGDSLLMIWSRPLVNTLGVPTTVLDFQLYSSAAPGLPAATRRHLAVTADTCATVARQGELGFFQVKANNGPILHGLALPVVEGGSTNAVFPADIGRRAATVHLVQIPHVPGFTEPGLAHTLSSSRVSRYAGELEESMEGKSGSLTRGPARLPGKAHILA